MKSESLKLFLSFVAIFSGCIFVFHYDPASFSFSAPCSFHSFTGLYCPGCGATRALHQLLHGNFTGAFGFNPLVVISLPFLIYSYISYTMKVLCSRSLPIAFMPASTGRVVLVLVVAFTVLRNMPYYPFNLLAP